MEMRVTGIMGIFEKSLGIEEPWFIRSVSTENNEVHIYVDVRDLAPMTCPVCGKTCRRAGFEETERVWRHTDVCLFPCYVHCRRPRVLCDDHKTRVVDAPWARKGGKLTYMMEHHVLLLLRDVPVRKLASLVKINEKTLRKTLIYWVNDAVEKDDLRSVERIAVDETSFKRGQKYVTVVSDVDKRRVIDVECGRSSECIYDFSLKLDKKGGDCNRIKHFSCDMSAAYKSGCETWFPKATITVDKFHVKQLILSGMDEVRKDEAGKKAKSKTAEKKLLMIPATRVNEEQKSRVAELCKKYPKTGRAYRMVQCLDEVYNCRTYDEAKQQLNRLISWLKRSRLDPMKKVGNTFRERKQEILSYFNSRITNAIAEGINSMIQTAKRKARGFNTIEGFMAMIYLVVGKLHLECPSML